MPSAISYLFAFGDRQGIDAANCYTTGRYPAAQGSRGENHDRCFRMDVLRKRSFRSYLSTRSLAALAIRSASSAGNSRLFCSSSTARAIAFT